MPQANSKIEIKIDMENNMAADASIGESSAGILEFAHMVLQVGDIDASRHFYLDLLGFTPRVAIPLADGRAVVPFKQGIALTKGNPGRPHQIDHMAFRVNGVRAIADRLKAADVKFFTELHDGVLGLTIYVADPDGNKIELFQEGVKLDA
jgi:catechol 2,3-dioxygenase-like lactoylglutathione lyase family enzyme